MRLLDLLPFANIVYHSRLMPEEILLRLGAVTEEKPKISFSFFGNKPIKPYQGQIQGMGFSIQRVINYRNSFLPRITGTVEKGIEGSTISVQMRLEAFVLVFIVIWSGGVGLACLAVVSSAFQNGDFEAASLIPFGMLLFMAVLVCGAFAYERNKSDKELRLLFESK